MPANASMVGREHALELLHDTLAMAMRLRHAADGAEATLIVDDQALTRFANNTIHQNVAQCGARLALRAMVDRGAEGHGVGIAVTNRLDAEGRRRLVENAVAMARLQTPGVEAVSGSGVSLLPGGGVVHPATTFYEATAEATAAQRADAVRTIVDAANSRGYLATGAFSTEQGELAIANTAGAEAYALLTLASLRTVVDANPSGEIGLLTGYADAISRDVDEIDPVAVATRAVEKCALNHDPQPLPPGQYVTVLEEIAVADLLRFLGRLGLSAQAVQEGRSFAAGKMGQQVCGDNFTLWDDAADARGLALPFDWEAVPAQRLSLIMDGVLEGLAYDTETAAKEGRESTGHAVPRIHGFGATWPAPTHLFVAPGEVARDELIAGVERGVLVTRFHYTHCPEPQRLVATGTTRDGTFLIEDGRIVGALKNARFTQSVLETFSNIEALSKTPELHRDWWGSAAHYVPAMRVRDFAFTGGAD
jgi:PmbA protein